MRPTLFNKHCWKLTENAISITVPMIRSNSLAGCGKCSRTIFWMLCEESNPNAVMFGVKSTFKTRWNSQRWDSRICLLPTIPLPASESIGD